MASRRAHLRPGDVLLLGRLIVLNPDCRSIRPSLGLEVFCPWCHELHAHGFADDDNFHRGMVTHREGHCLQTDSYFVGLDNRYSEATAKTIERFRDALASWPRRRLRHPEAEPRQSEANQALPVDGADGPDLGTFDREEFRAMLKRSQEALARAAVDQVEREHQTQPRVFRFDAAWISQVLDREQAQLRKSLSARSRIGSLA